MVLMEEEQIYTSQSPLQGLVVIKDSLYADGTFLVPYTLREALKEGYKVMMVCLANTISNYQYLLRKLATNLPTCIESRQVAVVEALSHQWLSDALSAEDAMKHLERKLAEASEGLLCGANAKLCIIFDSISLMRELCRSEASWRAFVHRCTSPGSFHQGGACVVMRMHADVDEATTWQTYLEHSAQVVIQVDALEAGQSQDITGQLMVKQRRLPPEWGDSASSKLSGGSGRMQHTRLLNYKLAENGVHLTSLRRPAPIVRR